MLCAMPSEESFLKATTVHLGGKFGFSKIGPVLSRDRLAEVDGALKAWWDVPVNDANGKRSASLSLIRACILWARKHQINSSASRTGAQRLIAVNAVVKEAKTCLLSLPPAIRSPLKSLDPGYRAERTNYKNAKNVGLKINPISGSFVHGIKTDSESPYFQAEAGAAKALAKDPSQMSDEDYKSIATAYGTGNPQETQVTYLNKDERLSHVLLISNGALCDRNLSPLTSDIAYAMDKYGLIYGKNLGKLSHGITTGYFNHSSFNAGKDVICAGEIIFNITKWHCDNKHIDYRFIGKNIINNASGHYQPTLGNLRDCVKSLTFSGLDLSSYIAGSPFTDDPYLPAADLIA